MRGTASNLVKGWHRIPATEIMNDQTVETPSFEEALNALESIISEMEDGEVPLDKLISRFEEGTKLVQVCQEHLKNAELKIDHFKKNLADPGDSSCSAEV